MLENWQGDESLLPTRERERFERIREQHRRWDHHLSVKHTLQASVGIFRRQRSHGFNLELLGGLNLPSRPGNKNNVLICSQDRGYDTSRIRDRDAQLQVATFEQHQRKLDSENHQNNECMKSSSHSDLFQIVAQEFLSRLCREFRSSSTLAQHTQIFPSGFQTSKFPEAPCS